MSIYKLKFTHITHTKPENYASGNPTPNNKNLQTRTPSPRTHFPRTDHKADRKFSLYL